MKTVRITAFVLAIIMLCSIFAGCNKDEEEKVEPVKEYTIRKYENNVYTTEFGDLSITIPEGWTAQTDQELAEMMGVELDPDDPSAYEKEVGSMKTIFDFSASSETNDSLIIMFEKPDNQNITEYLYAGIEMAKANEDVTVTFNDIETVTIAGDEYHTVQGSVSKGEGSTMMMEIFVKEVNGYYINLTFVCSDGVTIDNIIKTIE